MSISIDFDRNKITVKDYIIVCIVRNEKDNITYNSGLMYFKHKEALDLFISKVRRKVDVIHIDPYDPVPPEGQGLGYWCPYCQSWEYWKGDGLGYKRCPICNISDADYYVREFNKLWAVGMQSKSSKQKADRAFKKANKRRKK